MRFMRSNVEKKMIYCDNTRKPPWKKTTLENYKNYKYKKYKNQTKITIDNKNYNFILLINNYIINYIASFSTRNYYSIQINL